MNSDWSFLYPISIMSQLSKLLKDIYFLCASISLFENEVISKYYEEYMRHTPNVRAPKYVKKILTVPKRETDSNTIIVGDFCTHIQQ